MDEIWKDIKGYENEYQISNYGRIRSLRCWTGHIYLTRNKILNPSINTKGYLQVQLCKNRRRKQYLVHRIVAETFILKPNEKQNIVNHIDGNKLNNNVNNLEWCTQKQNVQHAIKNKLFDPHTQGSLKKSSNPTKRPVCQFDKNGNFIKRWDCIADVKRKLGIRSSHITECCRNKINSSGGYRWRYADEIQEILKIVKGEKE